MNEVKSVEAIIEANIILLKEVFVDRACTSVEYPGLCLQQAIEMCR